MSAEETAVTETNAEVNQPEQGAVEAAENEILQPTNDPVPTENDDPDWDDVPDPEDEDAGGDAEKTQTDGQDGQTAETDGAAAKEEADADGGEGKPDDPYAFLYDDNGNGGDRKEPQADIPEPPAAENTGGSGETALDKLNVDELIAGLEDGDLKDFADSYSEEAKMAAKMAIEVLKKLGFDQLRQEVARSSGTAREYERREMEMEAYAAQQKFEAAVTKVHADAAEIINGSGRVNFIGWLKNQPKFIQRRFRDSTDPEEAADILTRYKESRGVQMKKQQSRTAKIKGINGTAPQLVRTDDDVSWNDVRDEDVPEY